jgi:predicted regulator of Ras-like GTPase activity (Roadblock/LC7/MglB family)
LGIESLNRLLGQLRVEVLGIESAALVSDEGLVLASSGFGDIEQARTLATELANLGARSSAGASHGELALVLVQGARGYTLLMRAPDASLLALASADANLGLLLLGLRQAVGSIRSSA